MFFGLFKSKKQKVSIDASSQASKLGAHMAYAGMSHDQAVIADIPSVRIRKEGKSAKMYFCNMGYLQVKEVINNGDGKSIPSDVKLHGVKISKELLEKDRDAYYNLKNVKLYSNGTIQVIATSETKFEKV